jgi:hypothetical protein
MALVVGSTCALGKVSSAITIELVARMAVVMRIMDEIIVSVRGIDFSAATECDSVAVEK